MNYAMDGLNNYSTEEDINALALKHFDDQTLIQVNKLFYFVKFTLVFYII
jgi:hypothetical protein